MNKKAKWIYASKKIGEIAPEFRKEIILSKEIKKATLSITAVGTYVAYIDGNRVGDFILAPGFTQYYDRYQVQEYDVTDMLKGNSTHQLAIQLGKSEACSPFTYKRFIWINSFPLLIATLNIKYKDGKEENIVTNKTWDVYSTHTLTNGIYDGEYIDLNSKIESFGKAIEDKKNLAQGKLVKQVGEKIVECERVKPIGLIITPKGEKLIDFGQNLAGYVELKIKGKKGDVVSFDVAEVLDKDGNFYNENYRTATNLMTYVLDGKEHVLKPSFSYQGYRYIRLLKYPFEEVDLDSFTSIVIHSDMKRTGHFVCGNEKINQLYHNTVWGQISNYIDIPTDCPQRDERLGWIGDAQVFCKTAAINYDVNRFFEKWLGDLRLDQLKDGRVYSLSPQIVKDRNFAGISAGWADAATICPFEIYLAYDNKNLLKKCIPMMRKWVEYLNSHCNKDHLYFGRQSYGDWLALDKGPGEWIGNTQEAFLANAYFYRSTDLLARSYKVLGDEENYKKYKALAKKVKEAFRKHFMKDGLTTTYFPEGFEGYKDRLEVTQTSLSIAIDFELYDGEEELKKLSDKLVELIKENNNHFTTGFLGTPAIMPALSKAGESKVAYDLFLQESFPSWLYSVNNGATTIWEHYDGVNEKGEFWRKDMNSFNHYAYGSVFGWAFNYIGGITIPDDGAGYKKINIAPHTDKRLGFATWTIDTKYGTIKSHWYYKGDDVYYEFDIPDGVEANIQLENGKEEKVCGGKYFYAIKGE
jgi:alpha-L-rhamnosidase